MTKKVKIKDLEVKVRIIRSKKEGWIPMSELINMGTECIIATIDKLRNG